MYSDPPSDALILVCNNTLKCYKNTFKYCFVSGHYFHKFVTTFPTKFPGNNSVLVNNSLYFFDILSLSWTTFVDAYLVAYSKETDVMGLLNTL